MKFYHHSHVSCTDSSNMSQHKNHDRKNPSIYSIIFDSSVRTKKYARKIMSLISRESIDPHVPITRYKNKKKTYTPTNSTSATFLPKLTRSGNGSVSNSCEYNYGYG